MSSEHPTTQTPTPNGAGPTTPDEIEADIARQRDELAATVTPLQAKLDVKTRAQHKAAELRDRATTPSGSPRPELIAVAAGVVVLVGLLVWRRKH
jgi:MYXO-CTERM domain-containing protein